MFGLNVGYLDVSEPLGNEWFCPVCFFCADELPSQSTSMTSKTSTASPSAQKKTSASDPRRTADLLSFSPAEKAVPIASLDVLSKPLFPETATSTMSQVPVTRLSSLPVSTVPHIQDAGMLKRWEERLKQIRKQQEPSPEHGKKRVAPDSSTSSSSTLFPESPLLPKSSPSERVSPVPGAGQVNAQHIQASGNGLTQGQSAAVASPFASFAAAEAGASSSGVQKITPSSSPRHNTARPGSADVTASPATALVDQLLAATPQSLSARSLSSVGEAYQLDSPWHSHHSSPALKRRYGFNEYVFAEVHTTVDLLWLEFAFAQKY